MQIDNENTTLVVRCVHGVRTFTPKQNEKFYRVNVSDGLLMVRELRKRSNSTHPMFVPSALYAFPTSQVEEVITENANASSAT